jgi:hypothetical protein
LAAEIKLKTAFQITVDGTPGVTDLEGASLDGDSNGIGGGDYAAIVGAKFSFLDHDGDRVSLGLKKGGLMHLTRRPNGDARDLKMGLLGTVTASTALSGKVKANRAAPSDTCADIATVTGLGAGQRRLAPCGQKPGFRVGSISAVVVDALFDAGELTKLVNESVRNVK